MAQLSFKIDLTRCVGCRACEVACKSENNTPVGVRYRKVVDVLTGTFPNLKKQFVSMACFHCKDPACVAACPSGAAFKESAFGIVRIDQEVCVGCKRCIAACPYGAPQFNAATGTTEKCTMCYHRIVDETGVGLVPGMLPACVTSCIGRALTLEFDNGDVGEAPAKFADPTLTKPSVTFTT
ncbi:MAG: hypothetical protein AMXMBFR64_56890 [Myxococcales bacterium]